MTDVVVIDDHTFIREGLINALKKSGFNVIAEAASKAEARALLNKITPEICIIDINLGDGSGLEVIAEFKSKKKKIIFVVLTMDNDEANLAEARESGAAAYVLKSEPATELIEVLKKILENHNRFQLAGKIRKSAPRKKFDLTDKEIQVLQLLGSGATASVMGKQLFLTEATVKTHLSAIYRKLSASNRAQALQIAIANKLITD